MRKKNHIQRQGIFEKGTENKNEFSEIKIKRVLNLKINRRIEDEIQRIHQEKILKIKKEYRGKYYNRIRAPF